MKAVAYGVNGLKGSVIPQTPVSRKDFSFLGSQNLYALVSVGCRAQGLQRLIDKKRNRTSNRNDSNMFDELRYLTVD